MIHRLPKIVKCTNQLERWQPSIDSLGRAERTSQSIWPGRRLSLRLERPWLRLPGSGASAS